MQGDTAFQADVGDQFLERAVNCTPSGGPQIAMFCSRTIYSFMVSVPKDHEICRTG